MPNVRETTDAAATTATVYTLGIGQTAQGTLAALGDHDWYRVNLVAGQTYTFAMIGTGAVNEVGDTYLQLRNSAGALLTQNDDSGPSTSSSLTYTATVSGTFYLDAGSYADSYAGQYGLSATLGTRASFDEMMGAGALLVPGVSWSAPGTAANVTWAARQSFVGSTDASNNPAPFSQLTASEIASVRSAMQYYSDAANITFTQVNPGGYSNNATMLISNYTSTTDGAGAYALYPGDASVGASHGDIRLNTDSVNTSSQPRGDYSFYTIMHEMGHALGLAHPGDYNAGPGVNITYDQFAQFRQDSQQYTVMSYFDEDNTTSSYDSYADTLLLYDILAIQQLYGANTSTRTGNTIYGFGSNAGAVYDFALNTDPVLSIWDAGGIDTINGSGFWQAQRIDLSAGRFSDIGGFVNNVSIAFGAVIENATGGSGADVLTGNAAANVLNGMGGADTMRGGLGDDTYYVDIATDRVLEVASGGSDRVYTSVTYALAAGSQVEFLQFANRALTTTLNLTGNEFAQTMTGNAGANVLNGMGGADTMQGGLGNDTYYVDIATDRVLEAAGGGTDRVYTSVGYTLAAGSQVEFLQFADRTQTRALNLTGNEFAQTITGNAGVNVLVGRGGSDTLQGGAGADFFVFNAALAASNVDRLTDFTSADTIRLENAIFTHLVGTGTLSAAQFASNTTGAATNANQHIIYETDTGNLYYDSNGSAAGGSVLFARLNPGLALTSADFVII